VGYSKVIFEIFGEPGHFSPKVDKNWATAPRTRQRYPHEGPFLAEEQANLLAKLLLLYYSQA